LYGPAFSSTYSLSLHDALPIYRGLYLLRLAFEDGGDLVNRESLQGEENERLAVFVLGPPQGQFDHGHHLVSGSNIFRCGSASVGDDVLRRKHLIWLMVLQLGLVAAPY